MKLYSYWRSSASYRVRIALGLKGLAYEYVPVHLARGEQLGATHRSLSADGLVPVLEVDGLELTQSMAIIEYLDERFPEPALLPADVLGRAQVRALAQTVACEIHPLNNLRVLKYLKDPLQLEEEQKNTWYCHWARQGLLAFERQLEVLSARGARPAAWCFGSAPSLADILLVPQVYNAQRFDTPLDGLPLAMAAHDACMELSAFQAAHPSQCPDCDA